MDLCISYPVLLLSLVLSVPSCIMGVFRIKNVRLAKDQLPRISQSVTDQLGVLPPSAAHNSLDGLKTWNVFDFC